MASLFMLLFIFALCLGVGVLVIKYFDKIVSVSLVGCCVPAVGAAFLFFIVFFFMCLFAS